MLNRDYPIIHSNTQQEFLRMDTKVSKVDLRAALNRIVYDSMRPVTLWFGVVLLAATTTIHFFPIKKGSGVVSLVRMIIGVLFFGLHAALNRWSVPLELAHQISGLIAISGWFSRNGNRNSSSHCPPSRVAAA